ncbi:hypothetical protein, partial [Coleofasciculus sp. FACHB-712]|uniref:hypothetical protein n=1 Tax=Coleofasciculus sp. FACHB-712 TaxID=2692789 RepID=UPI001A7E3D38
PRKLYLSPVRSNIELTVSANHSIAIHLSHEILPVHIPGFFVMSGISALQILEDDYIYNQRVILRDQTNSFIKI